MGLHCRLGTLNSRTPRHYDVAYESRIWGFVASLNTHNCIGYDLGWVAWLTSAMKWPRKGWVLPLWEIQEWLVGMRVLCLRYLDSLILWRNIFYTSSGVWCSPECLVNLPSHALCPILCGKHQVDIECDLSIRCSFL